MSAIDQYKHTLLGEVQCPSSFEITGGREHRKIFVYELNEDVSKAETDFDGKTGDIILGGGSGECDSLRISIPEAISFLTDDEWIEFENIEDIVLSFWSMNSAYIFCEGYRRVGWEPSEKIEIWLSSHIVKFLIDNYYEKYKAFIGPNKINQSGLLCSVPSK